MINKPPIDEVAKHLSVDGEQVSRYAAIVIAAKRARQIMDKNNAGDAFLIKEISMACDEIMNDKIVCTKIVKQD